MKQEIKEFIAETAEKATFTYFRGDTNKLFQNDGLDLIYTEEAQDYFNDLLSKVNFVTWIDFSPTLVVNKVPSTPIKSPISSNFL